MNTRLEEIGTALRATKGILDVKWLDQETKKRALAFEEEAHKEVLPGGTGNYYNQGAVDVLSRKYICAVLNNNEFRHATEPSLFWVAGDIVIGEEITDDRCLQRLKEKNTVKILRKNFVLHLDRMKEARGIPPVFIVRGLPFYEIEDIGGIHDVISASPIGSADVYFKKQYGWDINDSALGTILIGFNLA
ncbi:MAG: hypothetical protein JRE28_02610 [Deltaproteobacteria bacterium]|nr:hypothetical protein [Deltaproteobacteria bacterium]